MKKQLLVYITFAIYSFIILYIVLLSRHFRYDMWREMWSGLRLQYGVNLIPFKTIGGYLKAICEGNIVTIAVRNLIGNLFLFLPMGIYLPLMKEKCRNLRSTVLISLLVLTGIELVQFVTLMGSLDIDDLILNLCGVIIGYGLWKWLKIIRHFNL